MTAAASLPPIPIIMRPTATGQTALSIRLAPALGAEIINADSIQISAHLRTIPARPHPDEDAPTPPHQMGI